MVVPVLVLLLTYVKFSAQQDNGNSTRAQGKGKYKCKIVSLTLFGPKVQSQGMKLFSRRTTRSRSAHQSNMY